MSSEINENGNILENTKTYAIDFDKKRIMGKTEGKEALKQAIYKILFTERYAYEIYDWNYGCELNSLLGKSGKQTEALAEKYIEAALLADERIEQITDFETEFEKNKLKISFTAKTIYGDINFEGEVK